MCWGSKEPSSSRPSQSAFEALTDSWEMMLGSPSFVVTSDRQLSSEQVDDIRQALKKGSQGTTFVLPHGAVAKPLVMREWPCAFCQSVHSVELTKCPNCGGPRPI